MTTLLADPVFSAAASLAVKATIVLGAAALLNVLLRARASAATRHLVWTLTAIALLLLPGLTLVVPAWPAITRVVVPAIDRQIAIAAADAPTDRAIVTTDAPADPAADRVNLPGPPTRASWTVLLATGYATGLGLMLTFLALQWRAARRLTSECDRVDDPEWSHLLHACASAMHVVRPVRLLRSRDRSMPVTLGIRRPVIVVPSIADTWSADRRRAVLLHELAHVARRDCLTQMLAWTACAVYWFHPAAWWTARRLQVERELACDDLVVAAGAGAREYAGHLLEIAYDFGAHRAPALAVSMARRRQLEHRLLALVDAARNRTVPALRLRLASAVTAVLLIALLAGATTREVAAAHQGGTQPATTDKSLVEIRPLDLALALVRATAAAFGVSQDRLPGTWEIRAGDREGLVHFRMTEVNSSYGTDLPIDRFEGLTSAQLAGTGPVQFRLRRDAGTFTFEGVAKNGVAAGTFSFTLNPAFAAEMKKRGFTAPTTLEQYQLARHDIGYAFADELNRQGYARPQMADLVRAGQHGVSTMYLSEMGALGYRFAALPPLITLRDHGVTPSYVRALAALGYKGLSADDARKARDHGISAEFVQDMRDAGYRDLTMAQLIDARDHGVSGEFANGLQGAGQTRMPLDELIRVRDHGVSPEYAAGLQKLGYTLPLPELIRARDHGVSVEYAQGMRDAGYGALTMDGLITARDHGVSLEFVDEIAAQGYGSLPIESLIRIRDHGVTPEYAKALKDLGYDRLTLDDLVTLRDHGLTPERIRSLNTRAGTRLPIDMLKSLASGGAQ